MQIYYPPLHYTHYYTTLITLRYTTLPLHYATLRYINYTTNTAATTTTTTTATNYCCYDYYHRHYYYYYHYYYY